ncbi:type I-C CRISPR-associated protein Cas8c/Csd1 [uncultured Cloacibacillus sp.]|uniref:type I-C CRISPR-associated protein Cas8c/Csd1 n=1 Tax=uncultured Cloacibacillus sp. TaxID=889794 RepID=UPI0026DB5F04|nr:type I-C CRISPR-associated protein Cas8c/Csd1 [uncultured Cloacibacillus sp.]
MILQSLANYYIRRANGPNCGGRVAPYGMEYKEIKFVIEIDEEGNFVNLVDMRDDKNNGRIFLVPKMMVRTGKNAWKIADLLWGHYGYVLGQLKKGPKAPNPEGQLQSFIIKINELPAKLKMEEDIAAVIKFYNRCEYKKVTQHRNWPECQKAANGYMTFRLYYESRAVTENPKLIEWIVADDGIKSTEQREDTIIGRCLVTGEESEIARIHAKVSISGNQATLVSFQTDSGYDSYGKEQGYNAPVSKKAVFYYTTALNMLLKSSGNNVAFLDAEKNVRVALLFWAEPHSLSEAEAADAELAVRAMIYGSKDENQKDADFGVINAQNIFEAIFTGCIPTETDDKFCVLGIAPNKARLSVVFWKRGTLKEIAGNIYRYLADIRLESYGGEITPSVIDVLRSSEYQGKMENVPSNMIPAMVYSIFNGTPFPSSVYGHVMERIRAERNPNSVRVAFVKAYLNRKYRNTKGAEIKVSLDKNCLDIAYRLGRLLAVLQKIQEEANPGLNATLMDRFYSSMSSTPASVLPTLLRLKNHHLAKLATGRKVYFEQLMTEIFACVQPNNIPKHMSLEEQGNFAVGYYHQREDLFKSKENKSTDKNRDE